jgi:integrase
LLWGIVWGNINIRIDFFRIMMKVKRNKTAYPGVYFILGKVSGNSKPEPIFYIRYRKKGKLIEEKVGSKTHNDITPARANNIRSDRIQGNQKSNKENRESVRALKEADNTRWTINKIWNQYKETNPAIKGLIVDENRFNKYIKEPIGYKEFKEICPLDIDRIRVNLLKKKSKATIKNVLELVRRLSNFAIKKHLCDGLNFTIQMPKVSNLKTEFLNEDEISKLWDSCNQDPNIQAANMIKLALSTGLRRGELFKLKWDDIEFKHGFISIKDPKGGPDEIIPLNPLAQSVLLSHPRSTSDYVFPGKNGQKRTDINHQINRIKNNAGLPKDFRPLHGLRHTYASILASSGQVDMYVLQKLLTHKSPTMTQRYAHLHDKALKSASSLAGDIIVNATKTILEYKKVV